MMSDIQNGCRITAAFKHIKEKFAKCQNLIFGRSDQAAPQKDTTFGNLITGNKAELENVYLEIIEKLCEGVYFVDAERRIIFWNKAAEDITGYKKEEVIGKHCQSNLLSHIDRTGRKLCLFVCPLYATILDGRQRRENIFLRHKNGHRVPVTINISPVLDKNGIVGAIEIFTPNSQSIYDGDLIEDLSNLAMHDELTGIANRRKIESYLEYQLHERIRLQTKLCVIFFDIDNFSRFNSTYGHHLGDEVLKSVSKNIMHNIRRNDLFGRWGGDEFIGVLEIKNEADAKLVTEKMRILISESKIPHEGENLSVTASFGVTLARDDDTADSIIKRVDSLMYPGKRENKNCINSDV